VIAGGLVPVALNDADHDLAARIVGAENPLGAEIIVEGEVVHQVVVQAEVEAETSATTTSLDAPVLVHQTDGGDALHAAGAVPGPGITVGGEAAKETRRTVVSARPLRTRQTTIILVVVVTVAVSPLHPLRPFLAG
jgi:hypothetical protein